MKVRKFEVSGLGDGSEAVRVFKGIAGLLGISEVVCTFGLYKDEWYSLRCVDSRGTEVFRDRKWHWWGIRRFSADDVAKMFVLSFIRGSGISGRPTDGVLVTLVSDSLSELKMKTSLLGGCVV